MDIHVFHFARRDHLVGLPFLGEVTNCSSNFQGTCIFHSSSKIDEMANQVRDLQSKSPNAVTVSLYNIHSLWDAKRNITPLCHEVPTTLSMAESEESFENYGKRYFVTAIKEFDGTSLTSSLSSVKRYYKEAYLDEKLFVNSTLKPFDSLIKGAAYISNHCLRPRLKNSGRDNVVKVLKRQKVRIDGLGRCMQSIDKRHVLKPRTNDTYQDLIHKRKAISNYLFYLAFENQIEPWYVTEKVFDALYAGIVPVYLGDAATCKQLLPDPKAAIFLQDFNNMNDFILYLKMLMKNEQVYEKHRMWRRNFNFTTYTSNHPLLKESWPCSICNWAYNKALKQRQGGTNEKFKCSLT